MTRREDDCSPVEVPMLCRTDLGYYGECPNCCTMHHFWSMDENYRTCDCGAQFMCGDEE